MVGAEFGRQLPSTPVRLAIFGFVSDRGQNPSFELGALWAGYVLITRTNTKKECFDYRLLVR
jgi:hypothetical protein